MGTDIDIDTRLAAARTRLILDKPFLGALVLRLPLQEADPRWCKTTATDARKFYYNAEYIVALSASETQFVLAHEALHCALSHFARRRHRIKHRWDLACDFAINPLLIREGLTPPPGALVEPRFEGMTAEEIYPCLDDLEDRQTHDQHAYDPDQGRNGDQQATTDADNSEASTDPEAGTRPQPLNDQERESLALQWRQRLAGAAQQALQAGKLDGGMARLVDYLLQPQLPWRMLLARYVTATAREDYSYARPSNRRGDPAIYPSLRSAQINLVAALDVSGSITEQEMSGFVAEIDALKGQLRARITLLACDSSLVDDGPWIYEPWEGLTLPRSFQGGGGTDFVPVFDWVAAQDRQPDLLLYFSDAQGRFPGQEPQYPVIWLIKGRGMVPWGQRVQLN